MTIHRKPKRVTSLRQPLDYFRAVLDYPDLTSSEKLVLLAMLRHNRSDLLGWSFPGVSLLIRETGLSDKTVRRATASLVKKGWLAQTFSGKGGSHGKANAYRLSVPEHSEYVIDPYSIGHSDPLDDNPNISIGHLESSIGHLESSIGHHDLTSALDFEVPVENLAPTGVIQDDPTLKPLTPDGSAVTPDPGEAAREDESRRQEDTDRAAREREELAREAAQERRRRAKLRELEKVREDLQGDGYGSILAAQEQSGDDPQWKHVLTMRQQKLTDTDSAISSLLTALGESPREELQPVPDSRINSK